MFIYVVYSLYVVPGTLDSGLWPAPQETADPHPEAQVSPSLLCSVIPVRDLRTKGFFCLTVIWKGEKRAFERSRSNKVKLDRRWSLSLISMHIMVLFLSAEKKDTPPVQTLCHDFSCQQLSACSAFLSFIKPGKENVGSHMERQKYCHVNHLFKCQGDPLPSCKDAY